MFIRCTIAVVMGMVGLSALAGEADWPQFRGPASAGVSGGAGNPDVVVKFQAPEKPLVPPLFCALTRQ